MASESYSKDPLYQVWRSAKGRCTNPTHQKFPRYGGRGITMCGEWAGPGGFLKFIAHIGPRPTPKHQLDRIDNDKGYEPGNVRWALPQVNLRNRGNFHRRITVNGETKLLVEWAEQMRVAPRLIAGRIDAGWSDERAVLTPAAYRGRNGNESLDREVVKALLVELGGNRTHVAKRLGVSNPTVTNWIRRWSEAGADQDFWKTQLAFRAGRGKAAKP